jgi:HSP20 family protein
MALVRWNPIREMEELSGRLNKLFGVDLVPRGGEEPLTAVEWTPSVDIVETEKEYLVKAELPEVKKEDVKVSVENGILTVQGERKQEKEEKGKKFHRIERSYGFFERSFTLPDNADETNISAEFKDGILNIHLAKSEKAKPKKIEVKAN